MVVEMYALAPVQALAVNFDLPRCMYPLPPIVALPKSNAPMAVASPANYDIEDVEERQSLLLSQLKMLQTRVASIRNEMGLQKVADIQKDSLKHVNVVVHADPRYPPYSLLCVANFLRKSGFVTKVNNHVHSTLKDPVNKNLAHHFDSSEWDECTESSESLLNFRLTVIWKLVGLDPLASLGFDIVKGEANILRQLVRNLSPIFPYETDRHQTLVFDSLMDDVHENVTWGADRDCVAFLERSESFFLSRDQRSFVDFLVWSALLNKRFTIPSRRLLQWYSVGLRENGIPLQRRNSSRMSESRGGSMPRNRKKTVSSSSNNLI